ncbi:MAG: hypothetical protein KC421_19800, partial [Anaerolineales bacterium]|nr:hypothetical protein [Anaerolineales bacterium]
MVNKNGQKQNGRFFHKFEPKLNVEAQEERRAREARIQALLNDEDELLGKAYDGRLVRRLLHFINPYKTRLYLAIVLMVVSSLLSVAGPSIIGVAIDNGIRAGSLETLRFWTILFIVAALVEWITNRARIAIMAYVGTRVVADLRSKLFRHLHTLTLNFHNNYSVGRLMSRLISDVGVLQDFVTWSITGLFRSVFILVGIVIAMLWQNWRLALVAFLVIPFMG